MSTIRKSSTLSHRYNVLAEPKSRVPVMTSTPASSSSPISNKSNRTTISQATIDRLATPKHLAHRLRTPTTLSRPRSNDVPRSRVDSVMRLREMDDEDVADSNVTDSYLDSLGGVDALGYGSQYARLRAMLFRLLESATPDNPILISDKAIARAQELREERLGRSSR